MKWWQKQQPVKRSPKHLRPPIGPYTPLENMIIAINYTTPSRGGRHKQTA